MKSKAALDSLELALIELEYASADFHHRRASLGPGDGIIDLRALEAKLMSAQRAVLAAVEALAAPSALPAADRAA